MNRVKIFKNHQPLKQMKEILVNEVLTEEIVAFAQTGSCKVDSSSPWQPVGRVKVYLRREKKKEEHSAGKVAGGRLCR